MATALYGQPTGSGTTGPVRATSAAARGSVRKPHLLQHFILKMIISPRQARDKHVGKLKKGSVFFAGHANASRIFDGYIATVGHGGVLNMNIAPDATGRLNASVVQVMAEAGKAINDTFYAAAQNAGAVQNVSGACADGVAVVMVRKTPFERTSFTLKRSFCQDRPWTNTEKKLKMDVFFFSEGGGRAV